MFYQNMPLYLKLNELLKIEYVYIKNIPKEYKYTLGYKIIDLTWGLIDLFIMIQISSTPSRKNDDINEMNTVFESLKLRIRYLLELKLISLKQSGYLQELLTEIGKMLGNWKKITSK